MTRQEERTNEIFIQNELSHCGYYAAFYRSVGKSGAMVEGIFRVARVWMSRTRVQWLTLEFTCQFINHQNIPESRTDSAVGE